jgi:hypothetical protein
MDDPVSEAACYLALLRHGQTDLFLVQKRAAEHAGPVAVIWSRVGETTTVEGDNRPAQRPGGFPGAAADPPRHGPSPRSGSFWRPALARMFGSARSRGRHDAQA